MKKKKGYLIAILLVIVVALTFYINKKYNERLGIINDSLTTVVKGTDLSPENLITNLKDGTSVEYKLDEENSKIIITLTNGTDIKTIEKQITILEPLGKIKEDATVNLYDGYKIEDLVTLDNEVKISDYNLNESTGELSITLSKEDRVETYNKTIKVEQPLVTNISENISIDLSKSYDINDYLNLEDGSEIQTEIDRDNQKIIITATKDNKTEIYEVPAEITISNPGLQNSSGETVWESYACNYQSVVGMNWLANWNYLKITFKSDNKVVLYDKWNNNYRYGNFINGKIYYDAPYNDPTNIETVWYDNDTESLVSQTPSGTTYYYKKVN